MTNETTTPQPISGVVAIKEFFGATVKEIKELTVEDREEMGPLCAAALGRPLLAKGDVAR